MGKFKVKNGLQVEGLVESSGTGTVITVDTASGEFSYTSSAALGAGGADGNGIYDGSGTVPNGTVTTLAGTYTVSSGSLSRISYTATETAFNDNAADIDFRVEGDSDSNLFRIDALNNSVAIGTTPSSGIKLFVIGSSTTNTGLRVQSGGTTLGYGVYSIANNISGSAEAGRFQSTQTTSAPNTIHIGLRAWADYGSNINFGVQGAVGSSAGINYSNSVMALSGYVSTNDNYPNIGTTHAIHGRNQRTKGTRKYGIFVDTVGTQETASCEIYTARFNQSAAAASGSTYAAYIQNSSLSQNNYGIYVNAQNATSNNYAIRTDNGSIVFNEIGGDNDVRIEGDTDSALFFTDASEDRVGVGKSLPNAKFDVNGNAIISGSFTTTGARVRNTRTITITDSNYNSPASINVNDDIVYVIDNTTAAAPIGSGSVDLSGLFNDTSGRCIELVKIKDGTGGGIILTALTMTGKALYLNDASQTNATRTVCTTVGSSLTIAASGAAASGSAWGTGW